MPITGAGTKQDPRRPKYSDPLREFNWTMIDFGAEPACMLGVGDIPDGVHSVLANYPDCVALPLNLDNQIGAQITQAPQRHRGPEHSSELGPGDAHLPASGARDRIHVCLRPRLNGEIGLGRLMDGTVTLATRFNQLPQATRSKLLEAAQSMNFNTSSLSGTSTIRQILKAMADQWGVLEIHIGGMIL